VVTVGCDSRRWVVERCFAWLGRNRRLAKDFEATVANTAASVSICGRCG
jgi:putative transposase